MRVLFEFFNQIGEEVMYEPFDNKTQGFITNEIEKFKEIYPGDYNIVPKLNNDNSLSYTLTFHNTKQQSLLLLRWS